MATSADLDADSAQQQQEETEVIELEAEYETGGELPHPPQSHRHNYPGFQHSVSGTPPPLPHPRASTGACSCNHNPPHSFLTTVHRHNQSQGRTKVLHLSSSTASSTTMGREAALVHGQHPRYCSPRDPQLFRSQSPVDQIYREPYQDDAEDFPSVIPLNVGGFRFMTRLSTLVKYPDSMLSVMFSGRHKLDKDKNGYYFIDSNGTFFGYILDFLRHETLPPNDIAVSVYKEACYYNIPPLVEKLQITPEVAKMLVRESHRSQFPDYHNLKQKIIRIAMDNAAVDRIGEVVIYAFRNQFVPRAPYFNNNHECVADAAHISVGPWESVADEETLIKCLEDDLQQEGFNIKPHEQRRRCKYYNGQNCQKSIYKMTLLFQ